ncbi:MAG: PIN domain-containing protein [Bacteroidales bacterium]|nr:PIN domain-containing protein [Bacteroidales bacterium]
MYLLDTDILIFTKRGRHGIQKRINDAGISNCVISEISLAELYVGAFKNANLRTLEMVKVLEDTFTVVPITPALKDFGKIKAHLELTGQVLDKMDIFIAATAMAGDYTLVTHNTKNFSRILGLKLEDWTEE